MKTRSTFARDVDLGRSLGLSYLNGDRVVTIPRYGGDPKAVYWTVSWEVADGFVKVAAGVTNTRSKAVAAITAAVKGSSK